MTRDERDARAARHRRVHRVVAGVPAAAGAPRIMTKRLGAENMDFTRITADPARMGGMPCIRNLRIPVATVVEMVADGMTPQEILKAYPDLEAADIREALRFAAEAVRERELPLLSDS